MKDIKWTDIVMAVFTIVIAGAAILQWREMVGGGTQTDKLVGYAKVQANAASDQADAAQQFSDTSEDINGRMSEAVDQLRAAADNAKASIRGTQDSLRIDQRAWLGIGNLSTPEFGIDKPFIVTIYFKNTGKTPALDTAASYTIRPGNRDSPDFSQLDPSTVRGIIFPGGESQVTLNATRKTDNKLPVDAYNSIKSGETVMLVYGLLTYKDVFGYKHWARSCAVFDTKGGTFTQCGNNNEIDQESR